MKGAGSWRPLRTNLEKEGLGPQVLAVTLLAAGGGRNSSQCEETWVVQQDTHPWCRESLRTPRKQGPGVG